MDTEIASGAVAAHDLRDGDDAENSPALKHVDDVEFQSHAVPASVGWGELANLNIDGEL
jgi:hypothetical protein